MKTISKLTNLVLIALIFTGFVACSDDDDNGNVIGTENDNSIADFVAENPDYSSLNAALIQTGLDATLEADGTYTVFAPNNAAFDAFLGDTDLADVDNTVLTQLLLNHVLAIEVTADQATTGYVKGLATEASSGANIDLYLNTASGIRINGDVEVDVANANIETDNGIIHPVNGVIDLPTIVDFAVTNPALTSLVAALTDDDNSDFTDLLSDTDADFTVFAPTNDAFAAFLDGATLDDVDNDALAQLLSNHVIPGAVAVSTGLSNSYVSTAARFDDGDDDNDDDDDDDTDAAISLYINTDDGVVLNGTSSVVQADIVAVNGVIHVVNAVIGLPDVTTFAIADPTFETLVAALTREDDYEYVAALQTENGDDPAPFTVFAPTNDAFAALLADLEVASLNDIDADVLAATLELHVVAGANVRAGDLADIDGASVETLGGAEITIDAATPAVIDPDGGSNAIIVTNVQAANGVIHAVSRVLRDL